MIKNNYSHEFANLLHESSITEFLKQKILQLLPKFSQAQLIRIYRVLKEEQKIKSFVMTELEQELSSPVFSVKIKDLNQSHKIKVLV